MRIKRKTVPIAVALTCGLPVEVLVFSPFLLLFCSFTKPHCKSSSVKTIHSALLGIFWGSEALFKSWSHHWSWVHVCNIARLLVSLKLLHQWAEMDKVASDCEGLTGFSLICRESYIESSEISPFLFGSLFVLKGNFSLKINNLGLVFTHTPKHLSSQCQAVSMMMNVPLLPPEWNLREGKRGQDVLEIFNLVQKSWVCLWFPKKQTIFLSWKLENKEKDTFLPRWCFPVWRSNQARFPLFAKFFFPLIFHIDIIIKHIIYVLCIHRNQTA